jgi:hypothetical protein
MNMSWDRMRVVEAGIACAVLVYWSAPALAQEYCVTCTQPNAVYRCVIMDARQAEGQPLTSFCVSTMAKQGGHAACNLRSGTVFDCDGAIKRIGVPAAAPSNATPGKPADQAKAPPATVERLARDAAKSSGEGFDKAGKSAGKVWTCITSLFTSC